MGWVSGWGLEDAGQRVNQQEQLPQLQLLVDVLSSSLNSLYSISPLQQGREREGGRERERERADEVVGRGACECAL